MLLLVHWQLYSKIQHALTGLRAGTFCEFIVPHELMACAGMPECMLSLIPGTVSSIYTEDMKALPALQAAKQIAMRSRLDMSICP